LLRVKSILKTGAIQMRTVRLVCWLALLAGALLYRLDWADAQVNAQANAPAPAPAPAPASPAAQQACAPDAMRLCADVIPDIPKVTACMKAKYSQLSDACRLAMGGGKHQEHHYRYRHCRHHCG